MQATQFSQWLILSPLMVLLAGAIVGVLIEAFVPAGARRKVQVVWSVISVLAAAVALTIVGIETYGKMPQTVGAGEYNADGLTFGAQAIMLIIGLLSILVMADQTEHGDGSFAGQPADVPGSRAEEMTQHLGYQRSEMFPLALFSLIGLMVFPAANSLLTLFIALEAFSLPFYILCATARRRRRISQESAIKYFVLGAFSSGFFLMGEAMLFGYSGTLTLSDIAKAVSSKGGNLDWLLLAGVVLMTVGLLFKVGAAPFHAWTPDVYQGAPTPISGFMAAGVKAAAFLAMARFYFTVAGQLGWNLVIFMWIVAILTMFVGTFWGLVQEDIKRMLAFSSIAHAGFILIAVIAMDNQSTSAIMFYLLSYAIATVGAFAAITLVRQSDAEGNILGEANQIDAWAGLGRKSPLLAGCMLVFLLSFAGIPLTAGFIGKFVLFATGLRAGLWPLVVIAVAASAITAFYYFNLARTMFMDEPASTSKAVKSQGITMPVVVICAILTVLLGVLPAPVLNFLTNATIFVP